MKTTKISKTSTIKNPVDLHLTLVQTNVLTIIKRRYAEGKLTMRSDIEVELGGKDKSWVCRILRALHDKGLIERYVQRYYKPIYKGL